MADHVNGGFEFGDGSGVPDGWTLASAAIYGLAGYLRTENLLDYSEEFDNVWWTPVGAAFTPSADEGPFEDPTDPAYMLVEDSSTGRHENEHALVAMGAATRITYSIYAKAVGRSILVIRGGDNPWGETFWDLNTGELLDVTANWSAPASDLITESEYIGNGWWRCSVTRTTTGGDTHALFGAAESFASGTYTGDGRDSLLLYGAQIAVGNAPLEYVRTAGSTARFEQGFDGYEVHWGGVEGYLYDFASAVSDVAAYTTPSIETLTYDGFEVDWDTNELYLFSLAGQATEATYFLGENLVLWSEVFDNAYWAKTNTTVDANSTGVPTGFTGQSDRLAENNSLGEHAVTGQAATVTTSVVFSVYAKESNRNWMWLRLFDGGSKSGAVHFDLTTGAGVVGSSTLVGGATLNASSIEDAGNGFYRCTIEIGNLTAGTVDASVGSAQSDSNFNYVGVPAQPTVAIIGAMVHDPAAPASYIETTATAGALVTDNETFEVQWDENETYNGDWVGITPAPLPVEYTDDDGNIDDWESFELELYLDDFSGGPHSPNSLAATFDGIDESATNGADVTGDYHIGNGSDRTIAVWLRTSYVSGTIFHSHVLSGPAQQGWGLSIVGGKPALWIAAVSATQEMKKQADTSINDSEWHLLVVTEHKVSSNNHTVNFYVDNILEATVNTIYNTLGANSIGAAGTAYVGGAEASGAVGDNFLGVLHDLAVWSVEMNATQVEELWDAGPNPRWENLSTWSDNEARWLLGDLDSAPTFGDGNANSNDLTMTNMDDSNIVETGAAIYTALGIQYRHENYESDWPTIVMVSF